MTEEAEEKVDKATKMDEEVNFKAEEEQQEEENVQIWIEKFPPCSFQNLSVIMTTCMENAFFRYFMHSVHSFIIWHFGAFRRYGLMIGRRPLLTIFLSLLLFALCAPGLLLWTKVTDNEALWTPYGSRVIRNLFIACPSNNKTYFLVCGGQKVDREKFSQG